MDVIRVSVIDIPHWTALRSEFDSVKPVVVTRMEGQDDELRISECQGYLLECTPHVVEVEQDSVSWLKTSRQGGHYCR